MRLPVIIQQTEDESQNDELPAARYKILEQRIDQHLRAPYLIYIFDHQGKRFCYFDCSVQQWKYNDLTESRVVNAEKFQEIDDFLRVVQELAPIAVTNEKIHLIGLLHYEYEIRTNCFRQSPSCIFPRTHPIVSHGSKEIFCISGQREGYYSKKCERFDRNTGQWTLMPNLLSPHGLGCALYFVEESKRKTLTSLIVFGGYASKSPLQYNPKIEIFNFDKNEWRELELTMTLARMPKFVKSPTMQTEKGTVLILGAKHSSHFYSLNIKKRKLVKKGIVPSLEIEPIRRKTTATNIELIINNNFEKNRSIKLDDTSNVNWVNVSSTT